jgi:hypothetical protein
MARLVKRPAAIWAAVLWIGGLGVLIGSVIFSTFGVASGSTSGNGGLTANQGAPGTSPWPVNVLALPSLPAGNNAIGTVHVANPSLTSAVSECRVDDGNSRCSTDAVGTSNDVIDTITAECTVPDTSKTVKVVYEINGSLVVPLVPLTMQQVTGLEYDGVLTGLEVPGGGAFTVIESYVASSGNGAICVFSDAGK